MNSDSENITVTIRDDFDIKKISKSGQCFRMSEQADGWYRAIAGDKVLLIKPTDIPQEYEVRTSQEDWKGFWKEYFDLDRSYSDIRRDCSGKIMFIDSAVQFGKGLRVLNQDPWEMLITFIISQRKSMPAIATAVENICQMFGTDLGDGIHAFPTPVQLASATETQLREASLGYRAPYVLDAARKVASGCVDLASLADLDDDELQEALMSFVGVGPKVANCISLFGYGRSSSVPIDVWIARAIDEECQGDNPFDQFGEDAGIVQQYVFFYMTQSKGNKAGV